MHVTDYMYSGRNKKKDPYTGHGANILTARKRRAFFTGSRGRNRANSPVVSGSGRGTVSRRIVQIGSGSGML